MFDVITMGSSTIDAFADTEGDEYIDIKTPTSEEELIAYPLGSKIVIKEMRYDVGGNGVNSAVALSRLGLNTAYLGKIGRDANGEKILQRLEEERVEFIGARGDKSGFSVILDSTMQEDRTILTFKGCNNDLRLEEIDQEKLDSKYIYLSSMLEDSLDTMKKVASQAKEKDMKIVYAPSSTVTKKGLDFVREIVEKSHAIILNEEEAEDLLDEKNAKDNLREFLNLGMEKAVITKGSEGVVATDGNQILEAKPHAECEVLETTGAGDACASAFVAGLAQNKNLETCIRMGMINSESVLRHYGAHNKLLNMEEMEGLLPGDEREMMWEEV